MTEEVLHRCGRGGREESEGQDLGGVQRAEGLVRILTFLAQSKLLSYQKDGQEYVSEVSSKASLTLLAVPSCVPSAPSVVSDPLGLGYTDNFFFLLTKTAVQLR